MHSDLKDVFDALSCVANSKDNVSNCSNEEMVGKCLSLSNSIKKSRNILIKSNLKPILKESNKNKCSTKKSLSKLFTKNIPVKYIKNNFDLASFDNKSVMSFQKPNFIIQNSNTTSSFFTEKPVYPKPIIQNFPSSHLHSSSLIASSFLSSTPPTHSKDSTSLIPSFQPSSVISLKSSSTPSLPFPSLSSYSPMAFNEPLKELEDLTRKFSMLKNQFLLASGKTELEVEEKRKRKEERKMEEIKKRKLEVVMGFGVDISDNPSTYSGKASSDLNQMYEELVDLSSKVLRTEEECREEKTMVPNLSHPVIKKNISNIDNSMNNSFNNNNNNFFYDSTQLHPSNLSFSRPAFLFAEDDKENVREKQEKKRGMEKRKGGGGLKSNNEKLRNNKKSVLFVDTTRNIEKSRIESLDKEQKSYMSDELLPSYTSLLRPSDTLIQFTPSPSLGDIPLPRNICKFLPTNTPEVSSFLPGEVYMSNHIQYPISSPISIHSRVGNDF